GQGHVNHRVAVFVDIDPVHQPEVHHVDSQFGVDDVLHRLDHLVFGDRRRSRDVDVGKIRTHVSSPPADACATASLNAIHGSSAHFTREGNCATPANATPSFKRSSPACS